MLQDKQHKTVPYDNFFKNIEAKQIMTTTRINTTINTELEKKFRKIAFAKFGLQKGSIKKGLEEAIGEWVKKNKKYNTPL